MNVDHPVDENPAKRRVILRAGCVYGIWVFIHYTAANLYPTYCAPSGISGFIASSVYAPSPQCVAIRWCIVKGAEALNTMWVVAATWCASHLIIPK